MTRLVFVAEITGAVDSLGTLQTWYVATEGFTTGPADSPANMPIPPYLSDPGNFRRELFSGSAMFGAVRPGWGEVVVRNVDGAYDAWAFAGLDGRPLVVRVGPAGGAYPSDFGVVIKCTMELGDVMSGEVRIRLRDRLALLDKPVLHASFAGTGGVEGGAPLAGVAKQRMFGDPAFTPVQLIDAAALTYWVADGSTGGVYSPQIWDGGMEITRGADYATLADVVGVAPAPGTARWYVGGPQIVRLGSQPTYDLRVRTGSYGPYGTWQSTSLMTELGVTDFAPGSTAFGLGGLFVADAQTTYAQLMDDAAGMALAWYGFDRLDRFSSGLVLGPSGDPVREFTPDDWISLERQPPSTGGVPVYRLAVSAGQVWPSSVATGVAPDMRARLTKQDWYEVWTHQDASILTKHAGAPAAQIELRQRFQSAMDWATWRDRYMALFGVERHQFTVRLRFALDLLDIDINSVVRLVGPRYGLSSGMLCRVVAVRHELVRMETTLVVWG